MENNQLLSALSKVPELVEQSKANRDDIVLLAEGLKKRMQAEIPDIEIQRLCEKVAERVSKTKCATPDTSTISRDIAEQIAAIVHSQVAEATKAAIESTPLKHEHYHTTGIELLKHADKKVQRRYYILLAALMSVCLIGAIALHSHINSKLYLGKEYAEVYFSEYVTDSERQALGESCYSISFIPKELSSNKALLKQRIKQNRMILKQRELDARANDGKLTIGTPLVR